MGHLITKAFICSFRLLIFLSPILKYLNEYRYQNVQVAKKKKPTALSNELRCIEHKCKPN